MRRYSSFVTTAPTTPQRRVATRPPAIASEVLVPTAAAIMSGLFAGAFASVVWGWLGGAGMLEMFAQVALLTAASLWFVLLLRCWQMLEMVEEQPVAEAAEAELPVMARPPLRVEVAQERTVRNLDLAATDEQLATLARGLLDGKPCTEAAWCGAGRPFSLDQFRSLRAEMAGAGLIRLRNPSAPQQGYTVTPSGGAMLRRLAGDAEE